MRRLKNEGADFVKVYDRLSRESFFALVDEARLQGLTFVGHVPMAVTAVEASDAGQRSIEHLWYGILLACSTREEEFRKQWLDTQQLSTKEMAESFSASKATTLSAHLQRNQTRVVPTLSLVWTMLGTARKDPKIVQADRLRYIGCIQFWCRVVRDALGETCLWRKLYRAGAERCATR